MVSVECLTDLQWSVVIGCIKIRFRRETWAGDLNVRTTGM
jgi:hypothetical protein